MAKQMYTHRARWSYDVANIDPEHKPSEFELELLFLANALNRGLITIDELSRLYMGLLKNPPRPEPEPVCNCRELPDDREYICEAHRAERQAELEF